MKIYRLTILILVVLILVSFFLPWVSVESGSQAITTRGFRISMISRSPDADYLINTAEEFSVYFGNIKKTGELVWVLPVLALLILCVVFFFAKIRPADLMIAVLGLTVFFAGVYKIYVWDLDTDACCLIPMYGLWITLYAYLGIGIAAAINFFGSSGEKI